MNIQWQKYIVRNKFWALLAISIFTILTNTAIFGFIYFTDIFIFLISTFITAIAGCIYLFVFNQIAHILKARFGKEDQLLKRLTLTICTFFIISGFFLYGLFFIYEALTIFNSKFYDYGFAWSYISINIFNIFLAFLIEGLSKYNEWKIDRKETEKLNEAYKQSQLNGLKSQVNPHFLFNSLNTLSSLIQDDEEKAEKFLDEMSKVYRYMLRNDDEQLVTLDMELKFVHSYAYLLNERYGNSLKIALSINEKDTEKLLPALTLQVIIENTFSQNVLDKHNPLIIEITSNGQGTLNISNAIRPKKITNTMDFEAGLDNLIKKYELLNRTAAVSDLNGSRYISLSLITKKEEAVI